MLTAGPRAERPRFDPKAEARAARTAKTQTSSPSQTKKVQGKPGPASNGELHTPLPTAQTPWEVDGRKWHTRDRVAANGRPARWDGRILEKVVDRIEELAGDRLATTEWSQRGVVRISIKDSTKISFPFFHATTSSEWVVTLRFFVPKKNFRLNTLENQLKLAPFHESETPVLCDQPRLRISELGGFQEITIVAHSAADFDTPGFDAFLKKAVSSFLGIGTPGKFKKASELSG